MGTEEVGGPPPTPEQNPAPDLQETMREVMGKLEGKNQELGGQLLARMGVGDSRFLIFPTPLMVDIPGRKVGGKPREKAAEFLVVTKDGFMLMEPYDFDENTFARMEGLIKEAMIPDGNIVFMESRYLDEKRVSGIDPDYKGKAINIRKQLDDGSILGSSAYTEGAGGNAQALLREINVSSQATLIIKNNLERAQKEAVKSRNLDEIVKANTQAARSLDQILG